MQWTKWLLSLEWLQICISVYFSKESVDFNHTSKVWFTDLFLIFVHTHTWFYALNATNCPRTTKKFRSTHLIKKGALEINCWIQAFHKSLQIRSDMLYKICIRTLTLKRLSGFDFRTPEVKLIENIVNNLLIM